MPAASRCVNVSDGTDQKQTHTHNKTCVQFKDSISDVAKTKLISVLAVLLNEALIRDCERAVNLCTDEQQSGNNDCGKVLVGNEF